VYRLARSRESAESCRSAIALLPQENQNAAAVEVKSVDEYAAMDLCTTADGKAGSP
jgi:hypothetical protein